jgi:hypothetical protein
VGGGWRRLAGARRLPGRASTDAAHAAPDPALRPPLAAAEALGDLLAASRCLSRLQLANCNIKPDVAAELVDGAGRCVSLVHLDLANNKIGDGGAAALGGALAGRVQLQVGRGAGCGGAPRAGARPAARQAPCAAAWLGR